MVTSEQVDKFAAVYAEAVLTYIDASEPQFLMWDGESEDFDFSSVALGDPRAPVMLIVDEGWSQVVGDVPAVTDVDAPDFDLEALRAAIEAQIAEEGYGERLLKGFQERLERIRDGDLDEDEEEDTD